ncbi:hypothetical protein [Kyrpidia spormannii]|uniref:hypothetical protein n=1 Tax=Kyrpidia spormannii TaxID=2055160 RepID=UPI0018E48EE8|nr:hypothetical protein [Kyrpidia spormannii]
MQPTRRARRSIFSVRTSWLNDDLPWNRSRIERRFERMHRIKRPIGFIESHATGNDTGGKARGDILTYGGVHLCHLAVLKEQRDYTRK